MGYGASWAPTVRPMARLATLRCAMAALALITMGCASGTAGPESTGAITTSTSVTPSPTRAPGDSGANDGRCDAERTAELVAVVEAQIAALSRDDFAAARDFATDAFRSQVTVEQFTMIITGSYGFLLAGPEIVVSDCQGDATTAELQVNVYAREPVVMGYLLQRHDAGWAIDAAAVIDTLEGIRA